MRKGQTLIEAVIAVAVIAIALVGFLSRSTSTHLASISSFNQTTAMNLAREGIELVRHGRDSNWFSGCPDPTGEKCIHWNTHLSNDTNYRALPVFMPEENQWTGQFIDEYLDECVASEVCRLYEVENNVITHDLTAFGATSPGEPTSFYRLIQMNPICELETACGGDGICVSGEECPGAQIGVQAVSQVRWHERQNWRNFELIEYLYNWR
jgi:type II secretory pathway pseudopilin PulG